MSLKALLKADFRNRWAGIEHATFSQKCRGMVFLFLLVAFFIAAEYLSYRVFNAFLSVGGATFEFIALILALRLLGLLFLIVMGLLYFGGMIAAIEALYFDDDIDFLASAPVRRSAVLTKKIISIWLTSAWVVFLIVTPVMTAYSRSLGMGFAHLPLSCFALFIFSIPSVALASATVMLLMRYMPVDKAKEAVLGFGALLSFGLVYLYRLLSPKTLARPDKLLADAKGFIQEMTMPVSSELPSSVMAQSLIAAAPLNYEPYFIELGKLSLFALVSLVIYYAIGNWFFETDRPVSGNASRPGFLERRLGMKPLVESLARFFPPGLRGLVFKEVMSNLRDPMQLSHLVLMMSITALHFMNLSEIPDIALVPAARVLIAFLNLGLVGFLMAGVAVRFVYPSISLEGKPFWIIETAPISPLRFVLLKFFASWIPLTVTALLVVTVSNIMIGIDRELMIQWSVATMAIATVTTALGIAIGITMPVFDRKNVFEISSSPGGIIFMLFALLYVGSVIVLLVPSTYEAAFHGGVFYSKETITSITVLVVIAACLTTIALRVAVNAMKVFSESKYGFS